MAAILRRQRLGFRIESTEYRLPIPRTTSSPIRDGMVRKRLEASPRVSTCSIPGNLTIIAVTLSASFGEFR
jgi:hypothetical protein